MYASSRLRQLVQDTPEEALTNNSLLMDTDPRHLKGKSVEDLELPGATLPAARPASSQAKTHGKTGGKRGTKGRRAAAAPKGESKAVSMSYLTPEQIAAEEAAMQDRILYEMRQNLQKLKEYGKEIGITLDISKKKSQHGRMQGERWHDEEMEVWREQATRMVRTPPPANNREAEEAPAMSRMGEYCFKLERILNEMRFERQRRQAKRDALDHEIKVTGEQEFREQSGAGKMAEMFGLLSKLRERIQDTDQRLLDEAAAKRLLDKEHAVERERTREAHNRVDEVTQELKNYTHDCGIVKLELKGQLHEVEKQLGQGKLLTMLEVKDGIKGKYGREMTERNKKIQKQVQVKAMLSEHEKRVAELTRQLQQQYDPNRDSPRRNELKRKLVAFEEVFATMMKRIGESDIPTIVQLFQKQALTHDAWAQAVRDGEERVKSLTDESQGLDVQLRELSETAQHGISNETRQFTISGRRLDMATERLDNSTARLMQLEGLIAHVKESIRQGLLRIQTSKPEVPVPPTVFPHDGVQGVGHWVQQYGEAVLALVPPQEQRDLLSARVDTIPTPDESPRRAARAQSPQKRLEEGAPGSPVMPRKLKSAIKLASADVSVEFVGDHNTRIQFPVARALQKSQQDKEREEDEQESRAEQLDESIVSRDEWTRRALRLLKQREREKAEREAIEKGEESPTKKKSKKKPPASAKPTSPG